MKKIISTQGLTGGSFYPLDLSKAIQERVDPQLEAFFRECYLADIRLSSMLSYELHGGEVTAIQLSYSPDHPIAQNLDWLREACQNFYNLYGFIIDDISEEPSVLFRATDLFDMASLIHALDSLTVSLESVLCAVDARLTDHDAIYSPSGAYLIQLPNVEHYQIPEGTLYISLHAARHSSRLQRLEIPYGMLFDNRSLAEYPQGLMIREWTTHYDGSSVDDNEIFIESR